MTAGETTRLALRIATCVLYSFVMFLLAWIIRLATWNRPRSRYRALARATSVWGHGVARIWGMRVRVEGSPPRDPFYLVCNHISYTDIVLLCAVTPAWFVSKSEVASWPGIGPLTRTALTVFIDRETRKDVRRMNTRIADLVRDGGSVGFFPEGTTFDGTTIHPFKPSLLQPAIELGIPVTVAAISYRTPPGSPPPEELVAWIGDDAFAPHAKRLLASPGFTATIRFAEEKVQAEDRKQLAAQAREVMLDLHRQLNGGTP